jgi:2,3-bisphosphoglycerate-independent phosphoglycerate mutase
MILIMDGFGLNPSSYGNAVAAARKPGLDRLMQDYPHTSLKASGLAVGLPEGQMGNSEVGHLNIGSGRVVYQEFTRISEEIRKGAFERNEALVYAMDRARTEGRALHLLGLVSDGGVHSHQDHLKALLAMAAHRGVPDVRIHCFLDGRDVAPRSAAAFLSGLEAEISALGVGRIATLAGRYYAMDRDKRWERVSKAYEAMASGHGISAPDALTGLSQAYERGEDDEFVVPTVIGEPAPVADGDSMVFFNFRPDRIREITRAFCDPAFAGFERTSLPRDLSIVTMTEYDPTLPGVTVAFPQIPIKNTLGEVLSGLGLRQLRIAETEKYAHVTFFFNGGVEAPNAGEDRVLIPSPKVPTYDMMPEMSAYLVTEEVLRRLEEDVYDVVILNFANADMVGHTGKFDAAVKAIETLEACIPRIAEAVLARDGQILLTADHGNADVMLDEAGHVVTAHSLNPVPLVHIANHPRTLADGGILADIAPTLLALMGLPQPLEMTGKSLLSD